MPKQTFQAAETRASTRLTHGLDTHPNYRDCANDLNQLVAGYEQHLSSQQTFAVGRLNQVLYIARQGVSQQAVAGIVAANYNCNAIVDCSVTGKIDELQLSGIHAEMMIIRYVVMSLGHAKGALSALGLEIATTKGCCLDCAGFLNEYNIPHTATGGKASLMWRHPISLTLYRHTNATSSSDLKFYTSVTFVNNAATQVLAQSNESLK